jgi:uncharacterized protein (TIGR03086 family)
VTDFPLDQALRSTLAILAKVGPDDLDAPTPCASWDVRALVNHFVGTARWWAAIVAGADASAGKAAGAGEFVARRDRAGFRFRGVLAAYTAAIGQGPCKKH